MVLRGFGWEARTGTGPNGSGRIPHGLRRPGWSPPDPQCEEDVARVPPEQTTGRSLVTRRASVSDDQRDRRGDPEDEHEEDAGDLDVERNLEGGR